MNKAKEPVEFDYKNGDVLQVVNTDRDELEYKGQYYIVTDKNYSDKEFKSIVLTRYSCSIAIENKLKPFWGGQFQGDAVVWKQCDIEDMNNYLKEPRDAWLDGCEHLVINAYAKQLTDAKVSLEKWFWDMLQGEVFESTGNMAQFTGSCLRLIGASETCVVALGSGDIGYMKSVLESCDTKLLYSTRQVPRRLRAKNKPSALPAANALADMSLIRDAINDVIDFIGEMQSERE